MSLEHLLLCFWAKNCDGSVRCHPVMILKRRVFGVGVDLGGAVLSSLSTISVFFFRFKILCTNRWKWKWKIFCVWGLFFVVSAPGFLCHLQPDAPVYQWHPDRHTEAYLQPPPLQSKPSLRVHTNRAAVNNLAGNSWFVSVLLLSVEDLSPQINPVKKKKSSIRKPVSLMWAAEGFSICWFKYLVTACSL